jgi:hypothetical protein
MDTMRGLHLQKWVLWPKATRKHWILRIRTPLSTRASTVRPASDRHSPYPRFSSTRLVRHAGPLWRHRRTGQVLVRGPARLIKRSGFGAAADKFPNRTAPARQLS